MNCTDVRRLLGPYADRELDLLQRVNIEEHLKGCAACAEQEENLRSLRTAVSTPSLYHRAPDGLRAKIKAGIAATAGDERGPVVARINGDQARSNRTWSSRFAAIAAGILLLAGTSATVGVIASRSRFSANEQLADWVVADHVRSLQVEHLTDVASSDHHTVKPWFRGKLDFSPQAPDLAAKGFQLTGGRLDYLFDRPVAALVYARRLHTINVFTWPAGSDGEKAAQNMARHGFHIRHWQQAGMVYWAISDLNDEEFDEFVRLFKEQSVEPSR